MLCECGCGQDAGYYKKTRNYANVFKGQPKRFINHHNTKTNSSEEQSRRGRFNDGSKLRGKPTGKGTAYTHYHQKHLHRVIAEQKLGRELLKGEVVHHIDGNKHNNHPENLEVMSSQSEHCRKHAIEYHQKRRNSRGVDNVNT